MVWRKHPDMSAYQEGQMDAENNISYLQEGGYAEMGFESPQAAIQSYGQSAYEFLEDPRVLADSEHQEMLRGYLSRFD